MMAPFYHYLNYFPLKHNTLIMGYMGDPSYGGHLLDVDNTVFNKNHIETSADYVLKQQPAKKINEFINTGIIANDDLYGYLKEGIIEELNKYSYIKGKYLCNNFDLRNRQWQFILRAFQEGAGLCMEFESPFVDYDFQDFMLTLDEELLKDRNFQHTAFSYDFPELAKIKLQGTNVPVNSSKWRRKLNEKKIYMKLAFYRFAEILSGGRSLYQFKDHYAPEDQYIREDIKDFVLQVLSNMRDKNRPVVNKNAIDNLLNLHLSGRKKYGRIIYNLLTLELWFQTFIDGDINE